MSDTAWIAICVCFFFTSLFTTMIINDSLENQLKMKEVAKALVEIKKLELQHECNNTHK